MRIYSCKCQESEEHVKRSEGDLSKLVWMGHCSLAALVRMVDRMINFDTWVGTWAKRFHLVSGFGFILHSTTWEMCSTLFHIFCFCSQIYVISQEPVLLSFYQAECVIYCMHSGRICNRNNVFGGQDLSLGVVSCTQTLRPGLHYRTQCPLCVCVCVRNSLLTKRITIMLTDICNLF